jgi:hypothetical protein
MQHATILVNAQSTQLACRNKTFSVRTKKKSNLAYHWEKYILKIEKPELDRS